MSLKLVNKNYHKENVSFGSLNEGGLFCFEDKLYIKINKFASNNSFNLSESRQATFSFESTLVELVDGELTYWKNLNAVDKGKIV